MQTLAALLSTFNLTKKEKEEITEAIAEHLSTAPVAPAPKKSPVKKLAHAMEMVETQNQNPAIFVVR